jgi:hypothetical protein
LGNGGGIKERQEKEDLLFVNKKQQKNFFYLGLRGWAVAGLLMLTQAVPLARSKSTKVFWFFCSKKNFFLALRVERLRKICEDVVDMFDAD